MPSFEPVTAVIRGLDVLRAVNRLQTASVRDIHRMTGINQPTVVRMLETLIHSGFVIRHPQQPVYMPAGRTLELSAGYVLHREVGLAATPVMTALRRNLGWPSDVAVFDGDAMIVAHTSRAEGRFLFERRPGYRAPILATSLGRAFLAFSDEAHRQQALALAGRSLEPWNAIAHRPKEAEAMFAAIRAAGFATMDEAYSAREYNGSASAIGVPILVQGMAKAALNVMYLREALSEAEAVDRFLPVLRQAAQDLSLTIPGLRSPA